MRSTLNPKRMLAPGRIRPCRFEPRIFGKVAGQGKLQLTRRFFRMRPDRRHLVRWFDLSPDDVVKAQVFLVEPGGNVFNIIDIPCDGMKMLTEAIVELLH